MSDTVNYTPPLADPVLAKALEPKKGDKPADEATRLKLRSADDAEWVDGVVKGIGLATSGAKAISGAT
jgi:hypothetical protein